MESNYYMNSEDDSLNTKENFNDTASVSSLPKTTKSYFHQILQRYEILK